MSEAIPHSEEPADNAGLLQGLKFPPPFLRIPRDPDVQIRSRGESASPTDRGRRRTPPAVCVYCSYMCVPLNILDVVPGRRAHLPECCRHSGRGRRPQSSEEPTEEGLNRANNVSHAKPKNNMRHSIQCRSTPLSRCFRRSFFCAEIVKKIKHPRAFRQHLRSPKTRKSLRMRCIALNAPQMYITPISNPPSKTRIRAFLRG
jgi:hypothetical protein